MGSVFSWCLSGIERNQLTQSEATEACNVTMLIEHLGQTYFAFVLNHQCVTAQSPTVINEFLKVAPAHAHPDDLHGTLGRLKMLHVATL